MSDKPDIEAISARLAAATPGPWYVSPAYVAAHGTEWEVEDKPDASGIWVAHCQNEANAEAIAHAPDDIAALLAEVERLQRERSEWCDQADRRLTDYMTQMRDLTAEGEECGGCDKRCSGDCDDSLAEYWRECYITSLDEWVRARKEIGQLRARLVIDAPMVERAVRKWCGSGKSSGVTIDTLMRATLEAALARPAPPPEPRLAYVPQGAPGTGAYIVGGEMLEALNALPKLRAENAELRARLELANKTKLQTMDDYHALQAEVAALRSLRYSVLSLGDTAQWRMRAEQRGYMVFCNAQDCADIADIQEELAALDAAGEGK